MKYQAGTASRAVGGVKKAEMADKYLVLVQWQGEGRKDSTWKVVSRMLIEELRRLKLDPRLRKVTHKCRLRVSVRADSFVL